MKKSLPDFTNTQIAFQAKSDQELKETVWLFEVMNKSWLVDIGSTLTKAAIFFRLPLVEPVLKRTIFKHFCGGINLLDCQEYIDSLYKHNTLTILHYGAEAKSTEEDIERTKEELIRSAELAASNNSVPVISCKLTALVDNEILERKQSNSLSSEGDLREYELFYTRISEICQRCYELGVGIFIDAEESWMQDAMDEVVNGLMEQYNKEKVVVYNTYQLYRHGVYDQLVQDHTIAQSKGYKLGAKLVRGAYMEKERERAKEQGYPSPIHMSKKEVDADFDKSLLFCLDHHEQIAFCCASHNQESNLLLAREVVERDIRKDHPHINFCQLQGMSDHITFNLAKAGFNVAKYVVYGPVNEVIEFLIRRAEENKSVTGEMSRELSLVKQEIKRRGL